MVNSSEMLEFISFWETLHKLSKNIDASKHWVGFYVNAVSIYITDIVYYIRHFQYGKTGSKDVHSDSRISL